MCYYRLPIIILVFLISFSCTQEPASTATNLFSAIEEEEGISGKESYLNSPYITPGNRVYAVGHQDGSFPDLGWHITGEMGGIWNHPIKLMDGFEATIIIGESPILLTKADQFTNYPFFNVLTYSLPENDLQIDRLQFSPDDVEGLIITYAIQNNGNSKLEGDFQIEFQSDLRPTWLGERTDMVDAQDSAYFDHTSSIWVFQDSNNPWFSLVKSSAIVDTAFTVANARLGKGASGVMESSVSVEAGSTQYLTYYISGSYTGLENAQKNMETMLDKEVATFEQKKQRYQSFAEMTQLTTPDEELNQTFKWLKYNADWFVRTVPEIGTGIAAGYPDYPWWFGCDSEYALQGYMAIGQYETALKTLKLLHELSEKENGNGRIVHEISSNGAVFNPGNINETPQFPTIVWDVYQWTGDKGLLEAYFPTIQKGLTWLMEENDEDGDLLPEGAGMMEIHGLESEMIDVVSYTYQGFESAAKIADVLGESSAADSYRETADKLKEKINEEFWSEDFGSYADFIGTDKQSLKLIEDALIRADTLNKPWAVAELQETKQYLLNKPSEEERPFVLYHNWVVNTPMEVGAADPDKAKKALQTGEQFTNPFGMFVTGIDRDQSAGSDDGSFEGSKSFSYTGAVMTLPTGVQARGENLYGNPDQALTYLQKMNRTFGFALPGSMYEVSPDYGMFAQAWNIYSYAVPIVRQFFGVEPDAASQTVSLQPQIPTDWDEASLENIKVGDNVISIYYRKESTGEIILRVTQKDPDWSINFLTPDGFQSESSSPTTKQGEVLEIKFQPVN
ncbi:MAG: trehalase family glycosidase [Bacteroidota bacterium]